MKKNMKNFLAQLVLLVVLLLSAFMIGDSLRPTPLGNDISAGLKNEGAFGRGQSNVIPKGEVKEEVGTEMEMEMYPTGSSLPDCAHACGPCNPCKRVMVSFRCPMAESCPVVYRCMCRGKYYQVPSN